MGIDFNNPIHVILVLMGGLVVLFQREIVAWTRQRLYRRALIGGAASLLVLAVQAPWAAVPIWLWLFRWQLWTLWRGHKTAQRHAVPGHTLAANSAPFTTEDRATGDRSLVEVLQHIDHPNAHTLRAVPCGGVALENPLCDLDAVRAAVAYMRRDNAEAFPATGPAFLAIPLGWYVQTEASGRKLIALAWTRFSTGIDNLLVTGMKGAGKDNLILWMLLCLMEQHTPQDVQFVLVDTKGTDLGAFKHKAHTRGLYSGEAQTRAAMGAITAEREKRRTLLATYNDRGIRKWSRIPDHERPPYLVMVISELYLMIQAVGEKDLMRWLNAELAAWRAMGGHFIVGTQNVSGMNTGFRSQISLNVGGAQSMDSADAPNVEFTTKHILTLGGVPPSQIPPLPNGAGVFLIASANQRSVLNVRASFIDDDAMIGILGRYPNQMRHGNDAFVAKEEAAREIYAVPIDDYVDELLAAPAVDRLLELRPLAWFEARRGVSLTDAEVVEYAVRRLEIELSFSRRQLALALWGNDGGSSTNGPFERTKRLWPAIEQACCTTPATTTPESA